MRLERIKLNGLGPFREPFEVDLADYGDAKLIAVTGDNGSGKSTSLELWGPGTLYRECPTRGKLGSLATARDSYLEATVVNGQRWTIRHSVDAVSGKGESLVLDAQGEPAFDGTKVSDFDQWSKRHLPPPEVLLTTVFAAQGSGGFIDMKPGERKGVLLRVLGVEHLEQKAKTCRDNAAAAKQAFAVAQALLESATTGPSVDAIKAELAEQDNAIKRHKRAVAKAKAEHEAARDQAARAEQERKDWQAEQDRRRDVALELEKAEAQLAALDRKIANNRDVIGNAKEIRAAVKRVAELRAQNEKAQADAYKAEAMGRQIQDAAKVLRDAETVAEAVKAVPDLKAADAEAHKAWEVADAALEDARAAQLAGAGERIAMLQGGLQGVINEGRRASQGHPPGITAEQGLEAVVEIAAGALDRDDKVERDTAERPKRIAALEAKAREALIASRQARDALLAAERLASQAPAIEKARAAKAEAEQALAALGEIPDHDRLQAEIADADRLARKAAPLDQAEGRLEELEPQREAIAARVGELKQAVAGSGASASPPPSAPDLAPFSRALTEAEATLGKAEQRRAVLRRDLEAAKESEAKAETHRADVAKHQADLADWNRLAQDLGRDGLQAHLVDASGPELSEISNDLLRAAFGPRWTISIETTRLDSTGKKQLEGCDVRVIDTVGGREAEASTFSGGERVILGEAVSLALTTLACRRAGVDRPTLIRDESGAALDAGKARAWVQMMRRAADLVGADRVLFVSHSPEIQEMADARIELPGVA